MKEGKTKSIGSCNSSSSQRSLNSVEVKALCRCGMIAKVSTSSTVRNPGRRFLGCPKWPSNDACGYFCWLENKMWERENEEVTDLLRELEEKDAQLVEKEDKIVKQEEEIRVLKKKLKVRNWLLVAAMGLVSVLWSNCSCETGCL